MDLRIYIWPIGALVVLYVIYGLFSGTWDFRKLYKGEDGRPSTSKFQFFLWFVAIFAAYIAVVAARHVLNVSPDAVPQLDQSLLLALGFSGATAVVAKQITTNYVNTGRVQKPSVSELLNTAGGVVPATGGILTSDDGSPDLGKIELIAWTLLAITIFLITVVQRISAGGPTIELPGIDPTLVSLAGIGQATYLGQKIVTMGTRTPDTLSSLSRITQESLKEPATANKITTP